MQRGLALSFFLLASPLFAQDDTYRYAYLSATEGEVSLQRASESEPEAGSLNVPVLPGDRIWTGRGSRAEIRFPSGLVIHLSEGAKLDFVAGDSETILRIWSGSAILRVADPSESLRIDSPAGSIRPTREGSYRIDVEGGDTVTLSVERGSAELASSLGTVLAQSGETTYATPSSPPSIPVGYNTARLDDFDRWSEERMAMRSTTHEVVVESLPHEVRSYVYDMSGYGDWYPEPDYGYVWYPRVDVGWAPYTYGRWRYTRFGHTWISSEPWGWAPYHYGRWGFGHRGWYWIPGATWGPAWVSFAFGPTWVGWSPLGFYNRPVFAFNTYFGGHRGGHFPHGGWDRHRGGWNVCSRDDFRRGVVTRDGYRRLEPESLRASAGSARFVDDVSALDRDLNVRSRTARLRSSASALRATADPPEPREGGPSSGEANPRSARMREADRRSTGASKGEEALRGFRERALSPSRRVLDEGSRTATRRGERGENTNAVTRARELRSAPTDRETVSREATPRSPRSPSSIVRERIGMTERSRASEDSEARPSERASRTPGMATMATTESSERARERSIPFRPSAREPATEPFSPSRARGRDSGEVRGPRARTPEVGSREAPPSSRSRVERDETSRASRTSRAPRAPGAPRESSAMPGSSREMRGARDGGSSVGTARSNDRGSSVGTARSTGRSGGASASRSQRSGTSRGSSARPRSNRS